MLPPLWRVRLYYIRLPEYTYILCNFSAAYTYFLLNEVVQFREIRPVEFRQFRYWLDTETLC
jgi:hypothetical protein